MNSIQSSQEHPPFSKTWLILLAFVLGLVYVFLPPPWQKSDEPGQFEYVWLVANLDRWPQPGDVDFQMRRDVLASMIEHGFYRNATQPPDLAQLTDPVYIGVPQMDGGQPLYYFLASLPLRLFPNADIDQQLYLARSVSLLLFVAAVFFATQAATVLFGNHLIGWMMAVFIALLPDLAYRTTAINDDAAAIAAMTFFIWMSVRGIKYGADWKTIIGIPVSIVLCALSKSTAWLAVPFGALALLLSIFRPRPRLVWLGSLGVAILVVLFAFDWRATLPADFYQYYGITRRSQPQQVVDGKYTFITDEQHAGFYQVLDKDKLTASTRMTNRKVTLGVWVWSNQPSEALSPTLLFDWRAILSAGEKISFSEKPVFFAVQMEIPKTYNAPLLRVFTRLIPAGVELYWDCFVLVPGARDLQSVPQTRENCSLVEWDGYSGENLIRNPSAEQGWFSLRSEVADFASQSYHLQMTDFWSVFDPTTSKLYFKDALQYLFRTFWGRFNWGTLTLVGNNTYLLFTVLSVLALFGNGVAVWRYRKNADWNLVLFLLLLFLASLIFTLYRFAEGWTNYYFLLPQSRYLHPVIVSTAFLICLGWYALLAVPLKMTNLKGKFVYIFAGLFFLYNGWAWYTIWAYWYK
ncbi:MAG: hypothetical protein ACYDHA_08785 [Bellilinea sp.]